MGLGAASASAAAWSHAGQIVATDAGGGQFSTGIAFNQTSDQIFVSNLSGTEIFIPGRLLRIDTAGDIQDEFGTGYFDGVAVDPSTGNVYGLNEAGLLGGESQIETFTAAGVPSGTPVKVPANPEATPQIASDSAGNIYFPNVETDLVQVYQPNGTPLKTINGAGANALTNPSAVAVDNTGNVYVVDSIGGGRTQKFDPAGNFVAVVDSAGSKGIGVDPVAGTVFVVRGSSTTTHVVAYSQAGVELDDFGLGDFAESLLPFALAQVAVDSGSGRVYVTDPGETVIETFDPAQAATATTEAATAITQTGATLKASVNANGSDADCEFEYGTDPGFATSTKVPCSSNPVTGSAANAVTAAVSGLTANTTYSFRVLTENAGGPANGSTLNFKTLVNAPAVVTGSATGVSQAAATLGGTVDANTSSAACKFEYGPSASYGKSVACSIDPVTGDTATAISAALSGLSAGTTYHYRVSATSAGGTSNGADATFTTAANTCETDKALCPLPPVVTPPAVTPPAVTPPARTKPLKCKKGFKKKTVKSKKKCVKVKKKHKKR